MDDSKKELIITNTEKKDLGKLKDPYGLNNLPKIDYNEEAILEDARLLHVYMGDAALLIPSDPDYKVYEGLKTKALATCDAVAFCIPDLNNPSSPILGLVHLSPSQSLLPILSEIRKRLAKLGIDNPKGFAEVIQGQTSIERGTKLLGPAELNKARNMRQQIKDLFPHLYAFPSEAVTNHVLSGHQSSNVTLYKSGRLKISGDGKAY